MTIVSKENHEKVLSERILYLILKPHMHSKKKKNPLMYLHCLALSTGEGNGTPLQYSCLENPMDGGAW